VGSDSKVSFKLVDNHRSLEEYATLGSSLVKQVCDLKLRQLQADPSAATFTVASDLTHTRQRQKRVDTLSVAHAVMIEWIEQERAQAAVDKEDKKRAKAQAKRAVNKKTGKRQSQEELSARPPNETENPIKTAACSMPARAGSRHDQPVWRTRQSSSTE
jgi:hypothetical protein